MDSGKRFGRESADWRENTDWKKRSFSAPGHGGDFHRTSDIGLAVSGGNAAGFALAVEEETATLLEYDIVNLDGTVQEELRERIRKEGVTLYEKA